VHRGSADVPKALTSVFNVGVENLNWNQLFVASSEQRGEVPWYACPTHRGEAERRSGILIPKVRSCMRAP
jgi:hypothetical protein